MKNTKTRQPVCLGFWVACLSVALLAVPAAQASVLSSLKVQQAAQSEETKGKKKSSTKSSKKSSKKTAEAAEPAAPATGATGTAAAATPDAEVAAAPTGKSNKPKGGGAKKMKGATEAAPAIRAVLDAQVVAWNAGKLEEFMRGYWNSPELTFVSGGRKLLGYDATIERYRRTYQADGKEMGKLTFSELEIMPLANDTAYVRGQWQLMMGDARELGGRFTLVFRQFADGWKVIYDHTSSN